MHRQAPTFVGKPNCANASISCSSLALASTPDSQTQAEVEEAAFSPDDVPPPGPGTSPDSCRRLGTMVGGGCPTACGGGSRVNGRWVGGNALRL